MIEVVKKYIVRYKTQVQNLGLYFLAALIPMVLNLVSNPFFAKNMSPTDYAITGYYSSFTSLFGTFVNFYILHYYNKRYFELDAENREKLKATIFKFLCTFSFLLFAIALAIVFIYSKYFNSDSQIPFFPYAIMSMVVMPLAGIVTLTSVDYRMAREGKKFFRLSVTNGVLAILLSLLFVVVIKWGAFGKMLGSVITTLGMFLFILYINRDCLKVKFDWKILKDALLFCWPLVIAAMLNFFTNGYDKVFLERLGDVRTLGIYSVGVSIAGYLRLFSTSIEDTFQPDIFKTIVDRDFRKCAMYVGIKLTIMSVCVVAFIIFCPFIIKILTFGRYVEATPYARIISLSALTSMLYSSFSQAVIALGYTGITLSNKIIGSILSIVSFNLLISNFGAEGAAWGLVLSYVYLLVGYAILVYIKYKKDKLKQIKNA